MIDKEKLLDLYKDYDIVYGPYSRKDGRKHIVLNKLGVSHNVKHKIKTLSFPKALMEVKLGRLLTEDETVDHIDRDVTNDCYSNLQILSRSQNSIKSVRRKLLKEENCVWCKKEFTPTAHQVGDDLKVFGPFCSKVCTGKYGSLVSLYKTKLERNHKTVYYRIDDLCESDETG